MNTLCYTFLTRINLVCKRPLQILYVYVMIMSLNLVYIMLFLKVLNKYLLYVSLVIRQTLLYIFLIYILVPVMMSAK